MDRDAIWNARLDRQNAGDSGSVGTAPQIPESLPTAATLPQATVPSLASAAQAMRIGTRVWILARRFGQAATREHFGNVN
jgi:hypothetical protein